MEYPNEDIECDRFARHRNWLETGRVAKRKPGGALRVLSEEAVNCISNRVTASSNESVRKLSNQTDMHLLNN